MVMLRRRRIVLQNLELGARYSLPLFMRTADLEHLVLADAEGRALPYCFDELYRAPDHRLVWLDYQMPSQGKRLAEAFVYDTPEALDGTPWGDRPAPVLPRLPEDVLLVADYFRDDVCPRWTIESAKDLEEAMEKQISVQPFGDVSGDEVPLEGGLAGQCLCLDPSRGHVAFVRQLPLPRGKLHARAYFFDHGEEHFAIGHWLACRSDLGKGAVGLPLGIDECYCFLHGSCPTGKKGEYSGWQRSDVPRSRGWHLFELSWERGALSIWVDQQMVSISNAAQGESEREVRIVSRSGGVGVWAGVEVLHGPQGIETRYAAGSEATQLSPQSVLPWQGHAAEEGRWQADQDGVVRNVAFREGMKVRVTDSLEILHICFSRVAGYVFRPGMERMLGREYQVLEVLPDGMIGLGAEDAGAPGETWHFPPFSLVILGPEAPQPAPPAEPAEDLPDPVAPDSTDSDAAPEAPEEEELAPASELPPEPPRGPVMFGDVAVECWTIPGESDISQMERVMTTFVQAMVDANLPLPENIRRVGRCPQGPQHPRCFVYAYGTRRLHVATRTTDIGRLLLVVRCGGGFMDFVQFSRKHGGMERVRFNRKATGGDGVMHFTSVLSRGAVSVRERPGSRPHSGPSTSSRRGPRTHS